MGRSCYQSCDEVKGEEVKEGKDWKRMKEIVFACPPKGFYIDVVTWEAKVTWKQKGAAFKVCSLPTSMKWGIPVIASGGGQTKKLWTLMYTGKLLEAFSV